jgi:nicotinamidase-related amidase
MERDQTALVVVDVQDKLLPAIHGREKLLRKTELLIAGAILNKIPIIVTEQYPAGIGPTEASIIAALGEHYQPIEKNTMSTLGEPSFVTALEKTNARQILLCGIEAHVCVYQTARDLRSEGRAVHLISDCVSSRDTDDKEIALRRMDQIGCCLSSSEMVIFDLLQVSGTPEFKEWIKLIR